MWCVLVGFIGGLVAAPVLALSGVPVVRKVVKGGIVAGHSVSDWAHRRRNDWHNMVQEARAELDANRTAANPPTM